MVHNPHIEYAKDSDNEKACKFTSAEVVILASVYLDLRSAPTYCEKFHEYSHGEYLWLRAVS